MNTDPNIAKIAGLLSEPSRAAILTALLDDRYYAAGELANRAGITPQTASFHLAKMVDTKIITVEKQGRHRYYRIENQEIAQILESLLYLAPPVEIKSFRQSNETKAIKQARTCYDHIAGNLGVQLTDSMINMGVLILEGKSLNLTDKGGAFFTEFQVDIPHVRKKRRSFSHKCLDWTERRYHLGGALGNALLEKFMELNWVQKKKNSRALTITQIGTKGLQDVFQIRIEAQKG